MPRGLDPTLVPHVPVMRTAGLIGLFAVTDPCPVLCLLLTWLTLWVWQQMFTHDLMTQGSAILVLAYALLGICVCFFHVSTT